MCITKIQGVRGATVADGNTPEAILSATREMLLAIMAANPSLQTEDLASAFFTRERLSTKSMTVIFSAGISISLRTSGMAH